MLETKLNGKVSTSRERGGNYTKAFIIMISHAFYLRRLNILRSLMKMGCEKIIQKKQFRMVSHSKLGGFKAWQSTSMGVIVGFSFRTWQGYRDPGEGGRYRIVGLVPTIPLPCPQLQNLSLSLYIVVTSNEQLGEIQFKEDSVEEIPGCYFPINMPHKVETPPSWPQILVQLW